MNSEIQTFSDREILVARPARNAVDPLRPYAFLVEPEAAAGGRVVDVATVFLTNRECPFRCLMCDLWKNTTQQTVPAGAIPQQIRYALNRLPPARHIKLYNSGNFFDRKAIPPADYGAIADCVRDFEHVIVENHPRLCGEACLRFQQLLEGPTFEIALGLETIHPQVLPALNKQMTLDDYSRAVEFLLAAGIAVRSFILLKPPFLDEEAGVEWALKSCEYAFQKGVSCCAVVPTRTGNGIMEHLEAANHFKHPQLTSLEQVQEEGLQIAKRYNARMLVDLWDIETFADCPHCLAPRRERLSRTNLSQQPLPPVDCARCGVAS